MICFPILSGAFSLSIYQNTIFSLIIFIHILYVDFFIDFCNCIMYTDSTRLLAMYTVIKRDGRSAEFNLTRISHAITKAFDATGIPYSPESIFFPFR